LHADETDAACPLWGSEANAPDGDRIIGKRSGASERNTALTYDAPPCWNVQMRSC
jgi:hypothetical protein